MDSKDSVELAFLLKGVSDPGPSKKSKQELRFDESSNLTISKNGFRVNNCH